MTRRTRIAALTAVVALAVAGCANNDAKESDVVGAMEDAGLDQAQAECIGEAMEAEYGDDQDLFNDIASAEDIADLPEGTEATIEGFLEDCVAGGGSDDSTDTTEAGDDTTDTTVEGDAETTTTTAGG